MAINSYEINSHEINGRLVTAVTAIPGTIFLATPFQYRNVAQFTATINGIDLPLSSLSIQLNYQGLSTVSLSMPTLDYQQDLIAAVGDTLTVSVTEIIAGIEQAPVELIQAPIHSRVTATQSHNAVALSVKAEDYLSWIKQTVDFPAINTRDFNENGFNFSAPVDWTLRPGDLMTYRNTLSEILKVNYSISSNAVGMTFEHGLFDQVGV